VPAVPIKPIIDVEHCGKRVKVEFARVQQGRGMKYDVVVNDKPVEVGLVAEEVMLWLGEVMHQEPEEPSYQRSH
jgi:hypothetical protein